MGKLKDLWEELKTLDNDNPRKKEVQKEINDIEEWMIGRGLKKDGTTKWYDNIRSDNYPWHSGAVYLEDLKLMSQYNSEHLNYNKDNSIHVCERCK